MNKNSDIKILKKELLIELDITEMYYDIVKRKPDEKGLDYFKNKILNEGKTIEWVKNKIVEFQKQYLENSKI